jgi:uncharacterized protein (TIGR02246 family)
MKTRILAALAAALLAAFGPSLADEPSQDPAAPPAPLSDRPDDEQAIRTLLRSYVEAYNAAKPDDLLALMTDDAALKDSAGNVTRGAEAIREQLAAGFAEAAGVTIAGQLEALRFFADEVAQAEGSFALTAPGDEQPSQTGTYTLIAVRRDGGWRIAELSDRADDLNAPIDDVPTAYERLQELEWMVGDWVDESEAARVTSRIRWADNRSFLVRTYSVEIAGEKASTGTVFLGWDPAGQQIKSWQFDSEGGHGEGYWTQITPGQWMVKARGVRRDGRTNSATQLHTVLSQDVVKSASFDRIIGGEPAPDIDEVIMVRKAPGPADLQAQPAAAAAEAPQVQADQAPASAGAQARPAEAPK